MCLAKSFELESRFFNFNGKIDLCVLKLRPWFLSSHLFTTSFFLGLFGPNTGLTRSIFLRLTLNCYQKLSFTLVGQSVRRFLSTLLLDNLLAVFSDLARLARNFTFTFGHKSF